MKNIFVFGASIVHGVGGARGGWADKLKTSLHRDLYGEDASGEVCEVYELGVPGSTVADTLRRIEGEIAARWWPAASPEETCIVLQCGTNDSKAIDQPDNYATSIEDFETTVTSLLDTVQRHAKHVVVVGLPPVDERKVRPKLNPLTGKQSYFSNERLAQFESVWEAACKARGVIFVPLHAQVPEDWAARYMFTDGIHPDDKGHEWIRAQVEPVVRQQLGDFE